MFRKSQSKRPLWKCAHCGNTIYEGERSKVTSTRDGIFHWHFDHGSDCLEDNRPAMAAKSQMEHEEDDDELDRIAVRGYE